MRGHANTAGLLEAPERSQPLLVISLDFELRWGRRDRLGLDMDAHRDKLEGMREVVPRLLEYLTERRLRVTWATVGAVACRNWSEYFARAPGMPRYANPPHADDRCYADLDRDGVLHFAPDLVDLVSRAVGQELGTHTFSHIAMGEVGVTAADVSADLAAVQRLWVERFGAPARSICFPRNQAAFLDVLREHGLRVWRGNPAPWFHRRKAPHDPALFRLLRLLDDLSPSSRRASALDGEMTRASLFLRPALPASAWRLQMLRIRRELAMARPGEIFHLWWHPENLGADPASLARVRDVLDVAAERVEQGAIVSRCMGDLVP